MNYYIADLHLGHANVHTTREYDILTKLRQEIIASHTERYHARGQFINVGCMMPWMDYTPRTLDEILVHEELPNIPSSSM